MELSTIRGRRPTMDLSTVRGRRPKPLFRPWNSYLAKKGAFEADAIARQLDADRARAHAGLIHHSTPLVRLTVKLIDTYEGINANYYLTRAALQSPQFQHLSQPPSPSHSRLSNPSNIPTHTNSSLNSNRNHSTDPLNILNATTIDSQHSTKSKPIYTTLHSIASPLAMQYCDENFDYIVRTGEMFNNRYMLEKIIGRGSFGQVVRALDTRENTHVAIKIIKNNSLYVEQALSEVRMTSYLNSIDPDDQHSIMRLRDKFIFRGHQCLVLELLSFSLYDLLRSTEFYGVSLNLVRKFCKQILNCLAFLARPDVNIAHCDLKPENVLLRHPQRSAIKVVDFGASCHISKSMFVYVQSRFYRAPEVILGLPYDTQVDVWSLGCMLVELHTGYPLFAGKDEGDQIAVIVERLGMPPHHMLQSGKKTSMFFEQNSLTGAWTLKPSISSDHGMSKAGSKPVRTFVDFHTGVMNGRRKRVSGGHSDEDYEIFLSLIAKMLQYDPAQRIAAEDALSDPFVFGSLVSARSGRDSPPQIPASLTSVGDGVQHELNPGRKAPVQRMRNDASIGGREVMDDIGGDRIVNKNIDTDRGGRGGVVAMSRRLSRRTQGNIGRSESGGGLSNVGCVLRLSKSEPLFEPIPKKTFVFKRSDWAEEVGIDPPPWRASGTSSGSVGERESWGGFGRGDGRNLVAAGGGCPLVPRVGRGRTGLGVRGIGSGAGCGAGCAGLAENASDSGGWTGAVALRGDHYGWEWQRARNECVFGVGPAGVAAAARVASGGDFRGIFQGRGVTPALPRGHGNALLLFKE